VWCDLCPLLSSQDLLGKINSQLWNGCRPLCENNIYSLKMKLDCGKMKITQPINGRLSEFNVTVHA
jgi:hypothetical protein